jgi:hypothetical protein
MSGTCPDIKESATIMRLLLDPLGEYHVSLDTVAEFQRAVLRDPRVQPVQANRIVAKAAHHLWRVLKVLHPHFPGFAAAGSPNDYFVTLMSADARRCMPYFMLPGRKSVYLLDAWPNTHEEIRDLVRSFSVQHLFLSSSIAARQLQGDLTECDVSWVPEAIEPESYTCLPPAGKDIDVLQLGRKYDILHQTLLTPLAQQGKVYLYEREKGKIIFPTRESFVDGLARTKISVCVPSSITHPGQSGDIEVLSMRYLQSMTSKCLVVGHAPAELISLFGYNPVVEIDMTDPAQHILSLLDTFADYSALIERNYDTVVQHHTWRHRWATISQKMFPGPPVSQKK